MSRSKPEGIRSRQAGEIRVRVVGPFLAGSRQDSFQDVRVPHARHAAVLPELVEVGGLNHEAGYPARLAHGLLGQLAQGVSELPGGVGKARWADVRKPSSFRLTDNPPVGSRVQRGNSTPPR